MWPDPRQRLVEVLCDEYAAAVKDVAQFQEHACQTTYPRFRDRVLRMAEAEKAQVDWLGKAVRALGGAIPEINFTVKSGRKSRECLGIDAEKEQHDYTTTMARIYAIAEQTDPEIARRLRRIYEEEKRHREELLEMLMKSDPQAALVGNVLADSG